jgi:arylsulfatase A-like enzyme
MLHRLSILVGVVIGIVCAACGRHSFATNVVFILADDLGFMDVGFNNPEAFYETPRLDALAKESVRFTAGYAACPVCSPTRSSILTGQYPARTRNTDYFGGPNGFDSIPEPYDAVRDGRFGGMANRPVLPAPYLSRLAGDHTTLAEALKAAGYATMHAGKWHLGGEGSLPTDHGFDVNIAGTSGGSPGGRGKYFSPYGNPYLPDGPPGEHLPDRLATEVAKFIAAHKDEKFFVYLPFYSVHTPLMAPKHLVEKYSAKREGRRLEPRCESEPPRENRTVQEHAVYAGMVESMDSAIGKVLDALEANGVADDTLVIFFSDNGGLSTGEGSPTSNLPYRAGKGWMYEGGIREPLLVRWPAKGKAGGVCAAPVISTDFYPTILEICGLAMRPEQHVDGVSFAKVLAEPAAKHDRPPLFWHYPHWGNQGGIPSSAIRDGDWKLITFAWKKTPELYNLADDPGERRNLAEARPEKLEELQARLADFMTKTGALGPAENPNPKLPFQKW